MEEYNKQPLSREDLKLEMSPRPMGNNARTPVELLDSLIYTYSFIFCIVVASLYHYGRGLVR